MRAFIATILLLFLVACLPAEIPVIEEPLVEIPPEVQEEMIPEPEVIPEPTARFTIERTEGELISLLPKAIDPDGDRVEYTFTEPFGSDGQWQTQVGDEGIYFVDVTAHDSKGKNTMETVRVVVRRANRAPVIDCKEVVVNEGEMLNLHDFCEITDEDDTEIIAIYSGWMSSWKYQTTYDDAGEHIVRITASDKRKKETLHVVTKDITVKVKDTNRAPAFSEDFPVIISAVENDVVKIPSGFVKDPDNDRITTRYQEPFNDKGVWRTKVGDAGIHEIEVSASDGKTTVKKTVTIQIALLNTPPELDYISDITVTEGETVVLPISATDREGDTLTVGVSGWMGRETYKTNYEDAGTHEVRVTISDGEYTASQNVKITVIDFNRPPVFVTPA